MSKELVPSGKKAAITGKKEQPGQVAMSSMTLNDAASILAGFSVMPDQLAKTHSELADKTLGGVVRNLIGYHWGDALAHKRVRNWVKLCQETEAIFQRRGTESPEDLSPNLAAPLLEACMDESREEMQKLWAGLLATARDPKRKRYFKIEFIEIFKKMDPSDALVLQTIWEIAPDARWGDVKSRFNPEAPHQVTFLDILSRFISLEDFEIFASLEILRRFGLLSEHGLNNEPQFTPLGKTFMMAVN